MRYIRKNDLSDRNNNIKISPQPNKVFLCYCNWSYIKEKHLKEEDALKIFEEFDKIKMPFYVRIFNEMPINVLNNFLEHNLIEKEKVIDIYNQLKKNTSIRIKDYE